MRLFSWDSIRKEQLNPKIWRKMVTGDRIMAAQVFIDKDGVVPLHQHENEQMTYIMEGALKFEIGGQEITVRKGEILHIPSNVPHSAVALEDTLDVDIFTPPRADWLSGQDGYLRKG